MPRKDHLPRQTRQEHITLQPNRSIEFRVTDDFGSFSPPHWHDALEIIYILEGSSIVTLSDRTKTVLPGQFLLINSGRIHTARCPSTGNRSILMQIPDAFLANYLPDPSQLWFSIDYDSTNPEVQKNISQFRRLLLSMMQLHEEMPDGYLLTFQRELFTFLDLTALTPARILTGYVVAGVVLSALGWYAPLAEFAGCGATVPLLGFGHLLAKGVRTALAEEGAIGILTGGLTAAAAGITTSLVCGVVCSLVGRSHDQN